MKELKRSANQVSREELSKGFSEEKNGGKYPSEIEEARPKKRQGALRRKEDPFK
jgi:hypothetical protein